MGRGKECVLSLVQCWAHANSKKNSSCLGVFFIC
jgi:hypothetical protein